MDGELNRYFIELQPDEGTDVPRYREAELRRALASQFLEKVGAWLKQNELTNKVTALAVTALGQVQITCEAEIISQMRSHDALNIAAIRTGSRPSALFAENVQRWNEAR